MMTRIMNKLFIWVSENLAWEYEILWVRTCKIGINYLLQKITFQEIMPTQYLVQAWTTDCGNRISHFNDLTIGWQNLNLLSHVHATLAQQARQAKDSGKNLNYVTLAPQLLAESLF